MSDWNTEEIKELSDVASFTITDMATWCGSGKSAMREWMTNGVTPHPIKQKYLRSRLDLIRWVLKNSAKLPVPMEVKQQDRTNYVLQVREYALEQFSKAGTSPRRHKVLDKHN